MTRVAEFFAGIGLVRMAFESRGLEVVWANDIDPSKHAMYAQNFDASDFVLDDVRSIKGHDIPDVDVATASFPCTDLSLAGNRRGLAGEQSSMIWEFTRILEEMGSKKPQVVLLENVPAFATSRNGADLEAAINRLNDLGYWCDLLVVDARYFVPQSRPRLFIIGSTTELGFSFPSLDSSLRPSWVRRFLTSHPDLQLNLLPLPAPQETMQSLNDVVEQIDDSDLIWWDSDRQARFERSLSNVQAKRLANMRSSRVITYATAFRRTREGKAVWEIRPDAISGCLRAVRGGSSRQAVVQAGCGNVRIRWLTPREYARLQGAPDYGLEGIPDNRALFGFGDAVCVPAVAWLIDNYITPVLNNTLDESLMGKTLLRQSPSHYRSLFVETSFHQTFTV